jgi:hypothetical protein
MCGLGPFCEIVNDHDDVLLATTKCWVTVHEINPPLAEWNDYDDGVDLKSWPFPIGFVTGAMFVEVVFH